MQRLWGNDGLLWWETNYVDGEIHGLERRWSYGQLRQETNYVNGKKHGFDRRYDENGVNHDFSRCFRDDVELSDWRKGTCP